MSGIIDCYSEHLTPAFEMQSQCTFSIVSCENTSRVVGGIVARERQG